VDASLREHHWPHREIHDVQLALEETPVLANCS
jgi:hypothetical protein